MHNLRRVIFPMLLLLVIAVAATWYLTQAGAPQKDAPLQGSGTVEAVEVMVSPQVSGRVAEVMVDEGDVVQPGMPLFRLEDDILNAQLQQAAAGLDYAKASLGAAQTAVDTAQVGVDSARVQYKIELDNARIQEMPDRLAAWTQSQPADFSLPVWYFGKMEEIRAAQKEADAAAQALQIEQANYDALVNSETGQKLVGAEARLAEAQASFMVADSVLKRAQAQSQQNLKDYAQNVYDSAQAELEAAQSNYEQILSGQAATDVLEGRARVTIARERHATALDRLTQLQTGDESPRVQAAKIAQEQAEAHLAQAQAQVSQAEKAIAQAQAQVNLISVQLKKLVVNAAVEGVVIARNIEPGEIVQPGAIALTISQLEHLTITVFIPEDRYGEIRLGEGVQVTVDSFPGEIFNASVTRIADQAEFTPRNVQTEEGRRSTVFAVKLSVSDAQNKLKPGMPADVIFTR